MGYMATDKQIAFTLYLMQARGYPTGWMSSSHKRLGATMRERTGKVTDWLKGMHKARISGVIDRLKREGKPTDAPTPEPQAPGPCLTSSQERTVTLGELARRHWAGTRQELADEIGVARGTLYLWMSGRAWPAEQHRIRLAESLGIPREQVERAAFELPESAKQLGKLIRQHWRGSMTSLAAKAEVTPQVLWNWVSGRSSIDATGAEAIARALGVPPGAVPSQAETRSPMARFVSSRWEGTQAALASAVGVDPGLLSRWMTGRATPRRNKAFQLARALGVRLDELPGREAAPSRLGALLDEHWPGTYRSLARLLDVREMTVCGWYAGRNAPNRENATALAAILHLPVETVDAL